MFTFAVLLPLGEQNNLSVMPHTTPTVIVTFFFGDPVVLQKEIKIIFQTVPYHQPTSSIIGSSYKPIANFGDLKPSLDGFLLRKLSFATVQIKVNRA